MSVVLIDPPSAQPVDLADAKKWLRVDHSDDDAEISDAIASATRRLDGYSGALGRCLISQKWALTLTSGVRGSSCGSFIRLPLAPVQTATVKLTDSAGTVTTIPDSEAMLVEDAIGPYIVPVVGSSFAGTAYSAQSIRVEFDAGYGDTGDKVPADIRTAIKIGVELEYDRPQGEDRQTLDAQWREIVGRYRRGQL